MSNNNLFHLINLKFHPAYSKYPGNINYNGGNKAKEHREQWCESYFEKEENYTHKGYHNYMKDICKDLNDKYKSINFPKP